MDAQETEALRLAIVVEKEAARQRDDAQKRAYEAYELWAEANAALLRLRVNLNA